MVFLIQLKFILIIMMSSGSTLYVGLARAVSPTNDKLPVDFFTNQNFRRLFIEDLSV